MATTSSALTLSSISSLLTEDILHQVVQDICKIKEYKPSKIIKYNVTYASGEGDNYIGTIFKITVNLQNDINISIIGKGLPADLERRKAYKCANFFEREIYFYNNVVPHLKNFETRQLGSKFQESFLKIPDCYYVMCDGKNDFLLLEDLKTDGYDMIDKSAGPNSEQIKSSLKLLAQFHAVSFAMRRECPDEFNKISNITELVFSEKEEEWIESYYLKLAKIFINAVEDCLKETEYLRKLKTFLDENTYFKSMISAVEYKENCVFNQGDAWIANFLFNKNQVKFIDFQVVRCGSPILDLSTFLFSCTNSEHRDKIGGMKGMLKIYETEFNNVVTSLGSPSASFLQSEWNKLGHFGFGMSAELAVLALIDDATQADVNNVEKITMADYIPLKEIKSDNGKRRLVELVKIAVDEGLI